ncbi:MAG TPA: hypothetical protein VGV09_09715 [Steroidobacteraceae bacterium]|nr:hypothetical protein [Steroidobacteraceae bacterium]
MYQKPTAPRTIGGVLDDTIQLFKAAFPSCWQPSLVMSLITSALGYFVFQSIPALGTRVSPALSPSEILNQYRGMMGALGIWYLVVLVCGLVFYGMLIANTAAVSRGTTLSFGTSFAKALRRAPELFVASVVFFIVIVIGFILLLIPGFYLWNRLQLFVVPLVDEARGPFASLGASWRAVGGNWWRTAAVVFVIFVILVVLQMVLTMLAGIVGAIGAVGAAASNPAALAGRIQLITLLVGSFVRIFTMPLIVAVYVALYQDLSLRKGGADLEARMGALPKG